MKIKVLKSLVVLSITLSSILGIASTAQAQSAHTNPPPKRLIEHVKGDVYLFHDSDNEWHTPHGAMFVVTSEGIVITDPVGKNSIQWLKAKLKKRFNKPVTHMIYSHAHSGHNTGGQAWGSDIEVISHETTKKHIQAGLTNTALPTTTFQEKLTLTIGNKTFEASFLGNKGHSDDLIAVIVRPENVAFVVDLVTPKRLPLANFPDTHIEGMIDQLKAVEALDFELMAPGHGSVGNKSDVIAQRTYIEELMMAVKAELKAGKSIDTMVQSIQMEKYKDWDQYRQWRELNIRGMAKWLKDNKKI